MPSGFWKIGGRIDAKLPLTPAVQFLDEKPVIFFAPIPNRIAVLSMVIAIRSGHGVYFLEVNLRRGNEHAHSITIDAIHGCSGHNQRHRAVVR